MSDRIAMLIGYGVMWLSAGAIFTALIGALMHQVWARIILPVYLLAEYHEWRRAKASGAWQWPRIVSRKDDEA